MDECTVGFRESRGPTWRPAQEVAKEEAALSRTATLCPECCSSLFTWATCGTEQSSQLFFCFRSHLFHLPHVQCMICWYEIKINIQKSGPCVSASFSNYHTWHTQMFSVKIYIIYCCKKIHIERNRHNFNPFSSNIFIHCSSINTAWACIRKKNLKNNINKKYLHTSFQKLVNKNIYIYIYI